ncbi:MAG: anti-sigma factor, partial [Candidatus Eisenbacteria bacterium]
DAKKAVLYASGLPRPPAGKDYQLWVIEGQTPRSEGVFPVNEQGRATHVLPEVPEPGGVGAFAVTLEPAGGVPQPTGDMVLLGAVPAQVN